MNVESVVEYCGVLCKSELFSGMVLISHQLHQQSSILTKLLQGQYLSHRRESPKFALYWGGIWTHELWKSVVDGALRRDCSKIQVLIRTLNEFIFA